MFISRLEQYGSIDIAENEFKRLIVEDDILLEEYREWCHTVGSSEKKDFLTAATNIKGLKIQFGNL